MGYDTYYFGGLVSDKPVSPETALEFEELRNHSYLKLASLPTGKCFFVLTSSGFLLLPDYLKNMDNSKTEKWLHHLVEWFDDRGYKMSGRMCFKGEADDDKWEIEVTDGSVKTRKRHRLVLMEVGQKRRSGSGVHSAPPQKRSRTSDEGEAEVEDMDEDEACESDSSDGMVNLSVRDCKEWRKKMESERGLSAADLEHVEEVCCQDGDLEPQVQKPVVKLTPKEEKNVNAAKEIVRRLYLESGEQGRETPRGDGDEEVDEDGDGGDEKDDEKGESESGLHAGDVAMGVVTRSRSKQIFSDRRRLGRLLSSMAPHAKSALCAALIRLTCDWRSKPSHLTGFVTAVTSLSLSDFPPSPLVLTIRSGSDHRSVEAARQVLALFRTARDVTVTGNLTDTTLLRLAELLAGGSGPEPESESELESESDWKSEEDARSARDPEAVPDRQTDTSESESNPAGPAPTPTSGRKRRRAATSGSESESRGGSRATAAQKTTVPASRRRTGGPAGRSESESKSEATPAARSESESEARVLETLEVEFDTMHILAGGGAAEVITGTGVLAMLRRLLKRSRRTLRCLRVKGLRRVSDSDVTAIAALCPNLTTLALLLDPQGHMAGATPSASSPFGLPFGSPFGLGGPTPESFLGMLLGRRLFGTGMGGPLGAGPFGGAGGASARTSAPTRWLSELGRLPVSSRLEWLEVPCWSCRPIGRELAALVHSDPDSDPFPDSGGEAARRASTARPTSESGEETGAGSGAMPGTRSESKPGPPVTRLRLRSLQIPPPRSESESESKPAPPLGRLRYLHVVPETPEAAVRLCPRMHRSRPGLRLRLKAVASGQWPFDDL